MKALYIISLLSLFCQSGVAQLQDSSISLSLQDKQVYKTYTGLLYNHQLFTKSLLLESALKMRERIYASQDTAIIQKYEAFITKRTLHYQMLEQSKDNDKNQGDLLKSEKEIQALARKLARQSGTYAKKLEEYVPHIWQEIKQELKEGEVVIEIIRSRQYHQKQQGSVNYTALIVTPKSKYPYPVILKNANMLEAKGMQQYLKSYGQDSVSYRRFWQPIHNYLIQKYPNAQKVYVSSDGIYHRVNIETLYNPTSGKFVFDLYDIQRVSNTKNILSKPKSNPAKNKPPAQQLVLFGDSLAGTQQEIKAIQKLLKTNQWIVTTHLAQGQKDTLQKQGFVGKKLHIATHGYFIKDDSLATLPNVQKYRKYPLIRAGLWWPKKISKTFQNKAILSTFEAQNLRLHQTDLVVLSADETGLGVVKSGEGVYGLPRAFKQAGAKHVLASLWKINREATQKLMQYFYSYLAQTPNSVDYHQALRLAKQRLRQTYPHPRDWGAFVLFD
ncbi:MAG TPA: hypothetical protein DCS93_41735 [Microscillaceae bacterium]|nr:hypothetical protein [Microscillaceae bacterium]